MADKVEVFSSSSLVHTGKGQVFGLVLTPSTGAPKVTLFDNTTNSGTKIFEAYVDEPIVIFFNDRQAPSFTTGLYIEMAANMTATLWTRQL